MYRDVVAVAKSLHRYTMTTPSHRLLYLRTGKADYFLKTLARNHGVDLSNLCQPMFTDFNLMIGVIIASVKISDYLDLRRRGLDVSAVRYEDLVSRPLDLCRVVLEFCHLPVSLAELGVKAFDVDSQANSLVAKSAVGHFKQQQLTEQSKAEINDILKKLGVTLIGEPNIIEGTLTCC